MHAYKIMPGLLMRSDEEGTQISRTSAQRRKVLTLTGAQVDLYSVNQVNDTTQVVVSPRRPRHQWRNSSCIMDDRLRSTRSHSRDQRPFKFLVCTIALMSSVVKMSYDVTEYAWPIALCDLSWYTRNRTGKESLLQFCLRAK